jgi:hypothetical protein
MVLPIMLKHAMAESVAKSMKAVEFGASQKSGWRNIAIALKWASGQNVKSLDYNSFAPQATPRGSANYGGEGSRQKREGLTRSGEWELSRLPIESVDFLCAGVPKQKRGIIGSHAEPDTPKTCLPEVFQIGHPLQLAVANAHSHH